MRVLLYYFLFSLALCVLTISCGGGGNRTLPAYLANYDTLIADWNASVVLQREGLPADEYARAVWSAVLYHRIIEDTAPDEIIVWDEKVPGDTLYEFAFDYFGRHPDAYFNTLLVFDKAYIDFYADRMEAAQEKLLSVIPLLDEVKEGYYLKYLVNGLLALIYTIHNMPEDEAYYQRAYDAAEAGGMPVFEARALSGLAHCHSDQGQYAQAIGEMKRVVAIGEKYSPSLHEQAWGELSRVFRLQGNADSSLYAARKSMELRRQQGKPPYQQVLCRSFIWAFLQLDQVDSAFFYSRKSFEVGDVYNREQVYDLFRQYYRQKGMTAEADRYALLHQQVSDTIDMLYKREEVAKAQYDYSKKQVTEAHARVSRERNNSILIGISVAVVLLVIIVWGRKAYRDRLHRREYLLHEKDEVINTLQTHLEEEKAHVEEVTGRLLDIEGREYELRHALTNDTELMQRLRKEPKFLDDSEWEKLKAVVDDVYKDFTVRLYERFPQLSEVYIRYCILIKLRFTVSQIAILMAVAPSSVSQQKSRIKKRLLQTEGFVFGEGETLDEWIGRF